jgi:hypothetical protein
MTDPPPGMIPVQLAKGCLLLLTDHEYRLGLQRGKWWRRRQAMQQRFESGGIGRNA